MYAEFIWGGKTRIHTPPSPPTPKEFLPKRKGKNKKEKKMYRASSDYVLTLCWHIHRVSFPTKFFFGYNSTYVIKSEEKDYFCGNENVIFFVVTK